MRLQLCDLLESSGFQGTEVGSTELRRRRAHSAHVGAACPADRRAAPGKAQQDTGASCACECFNDLEPVVFLVATRCLIYGGVPFKFMLHLLSRSPPTHVVLYYSTRNGNFE